MVMESLTDAVLNVLAYILLVLGYVFNLGLLTTPFIRLYAFWTADEGVGDHLPLMYMLSMFNSLTWVAYGSVQVPEQKAVVIISLISAVVQLCYTIWYMLICNNTTTIRVTTFFLVVELVFWVFLGYFLKYWPSLFGSSYNYLDVLALITAELMYYAPLLTDAARAFCTGNAAEMSIPIILASLGNAIFWGEYGRVLGMGLIKTSNEWGLLSTFLQLAVYFYIRWNEVPVIFNEEIPLFFHEIAECLRNMTMAIRVLIFGDAPVHDTSVDDTSLIQG